MTGTIWQAATSWAAKSFDLSAAVRKIALAAGLAMFAVTGAQAETRTLKLYYIHTGEKAEITFKRNGRYVQSGLSQLNRFLRDWRRGEPTKMDPRLFDVIWETYRSVRAGGYIHVVSAYRSPATNEMLRRTRGGQAKKSQHMLGKAMDFFIPGVKLSKIREAGFRIQGGGVGYYPTSGSPFVHLDVGNVRAWPRMSRAELARIFPNGKTLHVPADGKPLPGYAQAMAEYKKRRGGPISIDNSTDVASADGGSSKPRRGLLAALFGGGADEEEETGGAAAISAVTVKPAKPEKPARIEKPAKAEPEPATVAAEPRNALPGVGPAAESAPRPVPPAEVGTPAVVEPEKPAVLTPESVIAALPKRGAVPLPEFAQRATPPAEIPAAPTEQAEVAVAAAEPVSEGTPAPGIPLPSKRPSYTPAASSEQAIAALAAADVASEAPAANAIAAAVDPVPLPAKRPVAASGEIQVAALPTARPAFIDAGTASKSARVVPPTPKAAALQASAPAAREQAILGTSHAVGKEPRPDASAAAPEPRAIAAPIEPQTARWAIDGARVPKPSGQPTASAELRSAPATVIAAGFSPDAGPADAGRFTGKAVTFLSVVKFRQTH